jgi:hypothetical protein
MIGFAVAERCPYCRKQLGTLALKPGVSCYHAIKCPSRRCRKDRRPTLIFLVLDGRARALTGAERADIVRAAE